MRLIIVGCGRVGRLVARTAVRAGHEVAVVDVNPAALEDLGSGYTARRITGMGFDRATLLAAGVEHADALAAVTGADNANVLICLVARDEFHVPRVVARIYDPQQAEIYRRAGIPTVNPTSWGAGRITDLLWHPAWHVHEVLGEGGVQMVEAEIPHRLAGRSVDELNVPGEILVTVVTRSGASLVPYPGMAFAAGDRVYCTVRSASRGRLESQLAR
ncbi:MAG TPA: TrkA family potassium uptake protein [bacterium]|nr:TrkA family potassium uptake protein [bacterium]